MLATTTGVNVQLPQFEGPLALLLYLIRKEEMDIMDIQIHKITAQYLEYIKLMKELDLEVAGEFIAMAAALIHVKSRMLLPRYNDEGEIIETEDPRKELVQKLLEYQKFQEAAKNLYERPLLGRDVFARGFREKMETPEEEIVLEDNALFSLINAYRKAMKTMKKKIHKVANKAQSIASRIFEIRDWLTVGKQVPMSTLITSIENKRVQLLITFLSTLELAKMGFVRLFQTDTYQEIYIEATKPIMGDELGKVEEYESHGSEAEKETRSALDIAATLPPMQLEQMEFIEDAGEGAAPAMEMTTHVPLAESEIEARFIADAEMHADEEMMSMGSIGSAPTDADEIATDDELLAAERELGIEGGSMEVIVPELRLEPVVMNAEERILNEELAMVTETPAIDTETMETVAAMVEEEPAIEPAPIVEAAPNAEAAPEPPAGASAVDDAAKNQRAMNALNNAKAAWLAFEEGTTSEGVMPGELNQNYFGEAEGPTGSLKDDIDGEKA